MGNKALEYWNVWQAANRAILLTVHKAEALIGLHLLVGSSDVLFGGQARQGHG